MASTDQSPRRNRRFRRRLLLVQPLEDRRLLAADPPVDFGAPPDVTVTSLETAASPLEIHGEQIQPHNLLQFAKDLNTAGVVLYGSDWDPATTRQTMLFEDGASELAFIEVTNPDRTLSQIGFDNEITAFPTWEFADETRVTGIQTLAELSQLSGVAIPTGGGPVFKDVGDQTVFVGSPLHIPIDIYDPLGINPDSGGRESGVVYGDPLTVTVAVANPDLLDATVLQGNRSVRFDLETYGDMVFELFEQRASVATERFVELLQAGFYDDTIFHRVIDGFVIQGGDPTGTGSGGSSLDNFDDDYHPELQHNRTGVLSFAKSADDTGNSQFFVTEGPLRYLDFNYSIFGQLVEGEAVREAISRHAVNGADRPTDDIVINTIEVFEDQENSVILLKPTGNGVGMTSVTVTVTNQLGVEYSETFDVDVNSDASNSQPFLNPIQVAETYPNDRPAAIQVTSTDIEGDAVVYSAAMTSSNVDASASIDANGRLTVTPRSGFVGEVDVRVTVRPGAGVVGNSSSDSDNQVITLNFADVFDPDVSTNIITAGRVHQLHSIPAGADYTAIMFRAIEDATLSIFPIGTVSVNESVRVLDEDLVSIGQFEGGVTTATLREGELYAVMFDPQVADRLFSFQSSAGPDAFTTSTLTNLIQPTDVNGDGQTTPRDVLAVVNGIASRQAAEGERSFSDLEFLDSNRDGKITPLDALFVLNHLGRQPTGEVQVADQIQVATVNGQQVNSQQFNVLISKAGDESSDTPTVAPDEKIVQPDSRPLTQIGLGGHGMVPHDPSQIVDVALTDFEGPGLELLDQGLIASMVADLSHGDYRL